MRPNFWGGKVLDQGHCQVPSMEYLRESESYAIVPWRVAVLVCLSARLVVNIASDPPRF